MMQVAEPILVWLTTVMKIEVRAGARITASRHAAMGS